MKNETAARVAPFAVFMLVIGAQEAMSYIPGLPQGTFTEKAAAFLYPLRVLLAAALIAIFWKKYVEIDFRDLLKYRDTFLAAAVGLIVFALWVNMDFDFARFGEPKPFDPGALGSGPAKAAHMAVRLFGAAVIVPVMEELFWRSFLIRYIDKPDFLSVQVGRFSLSAFVISTVLFGLEHNMIAAGIMAGAAYNLLLYRSRSVTQCIVAHATTNLLLGVYVIMTGSWNFW